MKKLFRDKAIRKLQSPDELDEPLRVTSPRRWLSLLVLLGLVGAAILWGFYGRVATKVGGAGVFMKPGGVLQVVAAGTGLVRGLNVKPGDKIKAGDSVATLVNPELEKRLVEAGAELAELQSDKEVTVKFIKQEAEARHRGLALEKKNLKKKKKLIGERLKTLKLRMEAYEKLSKDGAVARQKVFDVQWQYDQALIALNKIDLGLIDLKVEAVKIRETKETRLLKEEFKVSGAQRKIAILKERLKESRFVHSTINGLILSILTDKGKMVHPGDPIASVQPDGGNLIFQLYVRAFKGKRVNPGMEVQITPSTVKRDEYGYMVGKVTEVSEYPVSTNELMSVINNRDLIKSLTRKGPVISVKAELVPDSSTASGFKWSSFKGSDVKINSGALGSAEIVVKERPPIILVIPALKRIIGI
jgi:HlyD family secretion protein